MVHDLAESEKVCPHDGAALEVVGDECSEQLRIVPAKFQVVVHKRLKYACPCCRGHMASAPLPPQPFRTKPTSKLGQGLAYIDAHWDGLTVFSRDGRVEIDTNLTENEIRPFAVGRRNWHFADTPTGAHASAALYTLIVTAKANGLNPYSYLVHVIRQLPTAGTLADVEALLPWQLTPEMIAAD